MRVTRTASSLVPFVTLTLAACGSDATAPVVSAIALEAQVLSAALTSGDTTSVVLRIRNDGAAPVAFVYESTCHLAIRLRDRASGAVVTGTASGWSCAADLSGRVLTPGADHAVTLLLHGIEPLPAHLQHGVHVDAGTFTVEARLTLAGQARVTSPIALDVR